MNVQTMIDDDSVVHGDHPSLGPIVQEMIGNEKHRHYVLKTAADLIDGDRARDYGDASEMHRRIAVGWTEILGVNVKAEQVALCMAWLKLARIVESPDHDDSCVDAVAYIALYAEIRKRNSAKAG